jgi:lactate permease
MLGVWPAALVAGVAFAVPQFLVSNFHGPWLVDTISGASSILALVVLLRVWKPVAAQPVLASQLATSPPIFPRGEPDAAAGNAPAKPPATEISLSKKQVFRSWLPWLVLTALMLVWGLPGFKAKLDRVASPGFAVPHLDKVVQRVPPVAVAGAPAEPAIFRMNFLSATGTGILVAAILSGMAMGYRVGDLARTYAQTIFRIRFSLLTIAAMLALGNVTKYSGADATIGLALARTGVLYPFFGTLLGWLGVALTGSDTASNVLFGSLQQITAAQTGLSPILMVAANSSGGVMGKMIDAQSIVVASTATNWYGHEGKILRYVFFHSLALAVLMGLLVLLQAYCAPFTRLVVH